VAGEAFLEAAEKKELPKQRRKPASVGKVHSFRRYVKGEARRLTWRKARERAHLTEKKNNVLQKGKLKGAKAREVKRDAPNLPAVEMTTERCGILLNQNHREKKKTTSVRGGEKRRGKKKLGEGTKFFRETKGTFWKPAGKKRSPTGATPQRAGRRLLQNAK